MAGITHLHLINEEKLDIFETSKVINSKITEALETNQKSILLKVEYPEIAGFVDTYVMIDAIAYFQ